MLLQWYRCWFKSKAGSPRLRGRTRSRFLRWCYPRLELLEDRTLPSTVTWTGGGGTFDWATAGNWDKVGGPVAGDDAVIKVPGITVTHSTGSDKVNSLAVTGANFTLSGGTLDVVGPSPNLSLTGGTFTLSGGTLQDATVAGGTTITGANAGSVGTLNAVTLAGTLDLQSVGATVQVEGGLTLKGGTVRLGNVAGTTVGNLNFTGPDQVVDGFSAALPGTITFGLNAGNEIEANFGGAGTHKLTLGSHLTVNGTAGQITAGGNPFDNQGLISADPSVLGTTAGPFTLTGTGWTNEGTIRALGGDTVTLGGSWSSLGGALNENASTLNLGGTFGATAGAADLGTVTRTAGVINLTGVLTNTGGTTLTLNDATGSWNLFGPGGITGGSLAATAGNALVAVRGGTLTGVTLDGTGGNVSPLDLQDPQGLGAQAQVQGGLTLKGSTIQLGNAAGTTSGQLIFTGPDQTVDGFDATHPGRIVFGLNAANEIEDDFGGAGTHKMTLGKNLTITGTAGQITAGGNPFDNQGLISADPGVLGTAAGAISLGGTGWTNEGTIRALGGDTVTLAGSWSSAGGKLNENASTLNLGGTVGATAGAAELGTVTRTAGVINLTGVLTNTGGTTLTLNDATGSWNLLGSGGGITGGGLAATAGNALVPADTNNPNSVGTLTGVTLDGTGGNASPLDLRGGGAVKVQGGLTLKGSTVQLGDAAGTNAGQLVFLGPDQTADGFSALLPGTITFGSNAGNQINDDVFNGTGKLTLGKNLTVTGSAGQVTAGSHAFDNQGLISADPGVLGTAAGAFTLTGTGWTNEGTIQALNGDTLLSQGTLGNFAAGALTGGTWKVFDNSTLRFTNVNIVTNAATILLDGTNSHLENNSPGTDALASFAANAAAGSFTIQNGRNVTTPGDFRNSGAMVLGPASTFSVSGNYTQDPAATLETDLGDRPANNPFGRLIATGTAALDGTLNAVLVNGFTTPAAGDNYQVLSFASHSGDFAHKNLPALSNGLSFKAAYSPSDSSNPTSLNLLVEFATLSQTSLDFGSQREGTTSAAQTVTLTNGGGDTLHVSGFDVTGPSAADFGVTPASAATTVAAGQHTSWMVTFTPSTVAAESATLTFHTDAGDRAVSLAGTGIAPTASVSPTRLDFGNQREGRTSAAQTVTVSNGGTDTLNVSGFDVTGASAADFGVTPSSAATIVAAGKSASWMVTFTPSTATAESATLTFHTDVGDRAVTLAGTGIAPGATVSPTSLDFGNQRQGTASAAQTVTVSNGGSDSLQVSGFDVTGASAADFAVTPASAATAVAGGSSASWMVTFTPSTAAAESATLTFHTDLGDRAVSLAGTGTTPATAAVSPTSLDFGNQRQGTASAAQSVTVSNGGTDMLDVTGYSVSSADFGVTPASADTTVAGGQHASWMVTFTPSGTGDESATLTFHTSAGDRPVKLAGTGIAPAAAVSPTSLDFGSQREGTASTAQTVTVSNSGTDTLQVSGFGVTGSSATDFGVTPASAATVVAGGQHASWMVTFTPSSTGAESATLTFHTGAGDRAVTLAGTGTTPATATVSPTGLDFGSQREGSPSAAQTVTVSNGGTDTLQVTGFSVTSADFAVTPASAATAVAAGGHASWMVTFTPSTATAETATLTFHTDAGDRAVSLAGTGIAATSPSPQVPAPEQTQVPFSFLLQLSPDQPQGRSFLVLHPSRGSNLVLPVDSIHFRGLPRLAGRPMLQLDVFSTGGISGVLARFAAARRHFQRATLVTLTADGRLLSSFALGGTSFSRVRRPRSGLRTATTDFRVAFDRSIAALLARPATATVSPTSVAFGSQRQGTAGAAQTVTVSNGGTNTLHVTGFSVTSADFAVTPASAATAVAGGKHASWKVTFTPSTAAAESATLTFHTSAGDRRVTLTGTGTGAAAPGGRAGALALLAAWRQQLAFDNQLAALAGSEIAQGQITPDAAAQVLLNTLGGQLIVNQFVINQSDPLQAPLAPALYQEILTDQFLLQQGFSGQLIVPYIYLQLTGNASVLAASLGV